HTRFSRDWSSDVCSSDLGDGVARTDHQASAEGRRARKGRVGFHGSRAYGAAATSRERLRELSGSGGRLNPHGGGHGPDRHHSHRSEERRVGEEGTTWKWG